MYVECVSSFKLVQCLLVMSHTHKHTHTRTHWLRGRAYSKSQLYISFGADAAWQISAFGSVCQTIHSEIKCAYLCIVCV